MPFIQTYLARVAQCSSIKQCQLSFTCSLNIIQFNKFLSASLSPPFHPPSPTIPSTEILEVFLKHSHPMML